MLYDVTKQTPAEPSLVDAFRYSLELMHESGTHAMSLMQAVLEEHGDLATGHPITYGEERKEAYYLPPEAVEAGMKAMASLGETILTQLKNAATLEQQETILQDGMRRMLDQCLMTLGHPQTVRTFNAAVMGIFEAYEEAGQPIPVPMQDMRERLTYYQNIIEDTLTGSEALLIRVQRDNGIPPAEMMGTPYTAAWRRDQKQRPVRNAQEHDSTALDERLRSEAWDMLGEMLEDYDHVLPTGISVDMVGLVLKCSEEVARIQANVRQVRSKRTLCAANDDADGNHSRIEINMPAITIGDPSGPLNVTSVFGDPHVRARVKHVLGQVFLKHPDAAASPQAMMDAAQSLDIALMAKERRSQGMQGR